MIGLEKGIVRICPYSNEWASLYKKEELNLKSIIGNLIISINHVGSTSIEGCDAKPIIDILIGLKTFDDGYKVRDLLDTNVYEYKGECGIPGRHFIKKNYGELTLYHIHAFENSNKEIERHLLFRDYLRNNKNYVVEYCKIKKRLGEKYPTNREAYTDGKAEFINMVIEKAKHENK